jgi:cell filamentation protein, protein adenylyltransferase
VPLIEWGLLPAPLLDLSAWIEPRRSDYYDHLLAVSTQGSWQPWLAFFLAGVAEQAADATRRARRLQHLREQYRARVTTARASSLLPQLVDALFVTPALTIGRAREVLRVTHRAATLAVERLVTAGLLAEVDAPGRTRLFRAPEIIAAANGDL